jgi:hypothetical protein
MGLTDGRLSGKQYRAGARTTIASFGVLSGV